MGKYCYDENINIEILMDLHIFSTPPHGKLISEVPPVCTAGCVPC
jgi:hypothetical protein